MTATPIISDNNKHDIVSFQELTDPFIEMLQKTIDELQTKSDFKVFQKTLDKIYQKFPLVDLMEFIEMYVNGDYTKDMISRFNLNGYADHKDILQILKLNLKRKSTQKNPKSRLINLTDPKLAKQYDTIKKKLNFFQSYMNDKIMHNVLRMTLTFLLYKNDDEYSSIEDLVNSIPDIINQFGHILASNCKNLLSTDRLVLTNMAKSILKEMNNESQLEVDMSGRVRFKHNQISLQNYILNIIRNQPGITHEKLVRKVHENLPLSSYLPHAVLLVTLDDLISKYLIIRKEGYWKLRPYFDGYFIFNDYIHNAKYMPKKRKFFGRHIEPADFIKEILALEKGDFEDQDDQVTRVAGMILSRSNMMKHPPNTLREFDFAVDLSEYKFTLNEQTMMQDMGIVLRSNSVYVKVMIGETLTPKILKNLTTLLLNRGRNEQGFVISFSRINTITKSMLDNNKTIQLITRDKLTKWCRLTPVIPSRRGAVAVVRQGDHKNSIAKIESVNYESGLATIILLPSMHSGTNYIGSLEEILLFSKSKKFIDYSSKYFMFLSKLYGISKTKKFIEIVTNDIPAPKTITPIITMNSGRIQGKFEKNIQVMINLSDRPDTNSLQYFTDDLFSCTCLKWINLSKTDGLCYHIIFTLNQIVKTILSDNSINNRQLEILLSQIEVKIDTFLERLKYSTNHPVVQCPHCGVQAMTLNEVQSLFGYRQMDPDKKFSLRRQSRCNKCRRSGNRS